MTRFGRTIALTQVVRELSRRRFVAFLESTDFETAIRLAISLGGDSDTLACITGGIAEAFYGMSEDWKIEVLRRLPEAFVEVVEEFYQKI